MEVVDNPTFRSNVRLTDSGKIRMVETELFSPMAHEFGHMLGLRDKYIETSEGSKPISEFREWNIMASEAGLGDVEEKNLKILLEKPLEWHRLRKLLFPDKKEKDIHSLFKNPFDFFSEDIYYWINFKNREF